MLDLVTYPDKRLRVPCKTVTEFGVELFEHITAVEMVLLRSKAGVGIAANQCGSSLRFMFMYANREKPLDSRQLFVNPVITKKSAEQQTHRDGCLSVPGFYAHTSRALAIDLTWQDRKGNPHEGEFIGWEAFIIQHEVDHLDGILFVDKLNRKLRRKFTAKCGEEE